MATGPNPFDDYEDLDAATPGEATLRPGPAPTFMESLSANFVQPFKTTLLPSLRLDADAQTVKRAERDGVAGPGSTPFDGKVSQQEADSARQRVAQAKKDKEAYEAFNSPTLAGKAVGLLGGLAGSLAAPENLIGSGGFFTTMVKTVGARVAVSAVEAGVVNAAIDLPTQGLQIHAGLEDKYSPLQTAAAFGVGALAGGGMEVLSHTIEARVAAREAAATPAASVDAPALAPTAGEATAALEAAHAAKGVDDDTLGKVAEGAAAATRGEDGSVQVPLSLDEGAAIAKAGAPVDEAGTMPGTAADALVREAEARGAVEVKENADGTADVTLPTETAEVPPLRDLMAQNAGIEDLRAHPDLAAAEAKMSEIPRTDQREGYGTPEFWASREYDVNGEKVVGREAVTAKLIEGARAFSTAGPVENKRQAYIVLGPPAAGKSTIAEKIATDARAAIVDSDEAKKVIPEFQGGIGAAAVHEESGDLIKGVQNGLVREGANVVIPKVGDNISSISKLTENLKLLDYDVHVVNLTVSPENAFRRMVGRFQSTGRLIPPDYFLSVGDRPRNTYYELRRQNAASSYVDIDGNGPRGAPQPVLDGDGTARAIFESTELRGGRQQDSGQAERGLGGADPRAPATEDAGTGPARAQPAAGPAGEVGPTLLGPAPTGLPAHRVTTASGRTIEVQPVVVEARDLLTSADAGYDKALQPRQRDRAASQAQIREIATGLDPERLGYSAEADRGAPIVGDDGMVESGNGRVLAIRSVYEKAGKEADAYRAFIEAQGIDTSGMKEPVLVRQRTTPLTTEERAAFGTEANQAATLSMSAAERGMSDARLISPEMLDLIRNADDLGAAANLDFRKAFAKALPASERGSMTAAGGEMSAEGLTRVRNAVLARAYGDSGVLARIAEATSDDVKSISNALAAAAPEWAKLRSDIDTGLVRSDVDMTPSLLEAVNRTAELRGKGEKLDTFLAQQDAFDKLDQSVEDWMRMFYDAKGRRAAGAPVIAERLRAYAIEARKVSADGGLDLGLPTVTARDLQAQAAKRGQKNGTEGQGGFELIQGGRSGETGVQPGGSAGDVAGNAADGRDGRRAGGKGAGARAAGGAQPLRRDAPRSVNDLVAETRALNSARDERAATIVDAVKATGRFSTTGKAGERIGISKSAREGGNWQVTKFDGGEPTGHVLFDDLAAAAKYVSREEPRPDVQPLNKAASSARDNPDARFDRRELAGEADKPRALPADATAAEVAAFRISDAMRGIAERMGRKLELDGRFTARGALGEYKPGEGVLRIRAEGDVEVFAHELGHALDQELAKSPSWETFTKTFERELKALDANTPDQPSVSEGIAEFLRGYITNPAYAKRQNPAMADVFEKLIARDRPDLASIVKDASRLSQIDSGMEPADVLRTMITTAIEPTGLAKFNQERKAMGLLPTLSLWFDRAYAGMFGKDHWVRRFTEELRGAHFQATGKPMPEFTQSAGMGFRDPYQSYRMLAGAKQAAVDGMYEGPKAYGGALGGRVAPGVYQALDKAFKGHVTLIDNPNDPLVRSFSAYLIARRAKALYARWENGELRNPPIRASKNEVEAGLITLEKENPQFKEAADDIIAFSNAMWQKKFDAGIISREINDIVSNRNDDYVPFYRDFRNEKAGSGGKGGGGLNSNGVKTLKGSSRDILDPVHSIIFDAMQTERIIALNDTFKFMHRLAQTGGEFSGRFMERVPNSEMKAQSFDLAEGMRNAARAAGLEKADAEVMIRHLEEMVGDDMSATVFKATDVTAKGERIMFYWEGGERVALKVGDNEVAKQFFDLLSGQSAAERDIMLALIGKANGLFSQLITNAPQFALKNIIMDNASRIFIARNTGALGRIPGAAIAAGVYTSIFDKEFARAYAAVGGIRGGIVSAATRELDEIRGVRGIALRPKDLEAMAKEAMDLLGNPRDLAIAVAKSPLHALEAIIRGIEATETVGRLGQAKIVNRHLRKQGVDPEEAFRAAAYEARDVLDYDRKGWAVGNASRILPFLNAGFQGLDRSQRNLFGAPMKAAIDSYKRGGYANLDGEAKSALKDAVMNWGLIAGGVATTMSYYAMNADDPVYQRMSDYMKRRYYVFPGGQRADGTQMVVTVPKPFDHAGGIFSAVEAAMDGIRRQDPETWHKVTKNLQEGFIPRQLGGIQEFMGSLPPTLKVPFEVLTGTKLGFDGGPSFPIVPANLKALPPEMQFTGTTGYLSKKMGEWFGVSPVVAEHVMTGLGGTTARDASTLATAIFDDQPNVTMGDAMTRTFFGALYRGQQGGGSFKSDLMQVMGRDNGQYAVLAKGYSQAKEEGDEEQAASIYTRGNDIAKTVMSIRGGKFKPEERQVHPLERTVALGDILSKVTRDLSTAQVEKIDRSRKHGQEREYIDLQPTTARALTGTIGYLMAEEIRNGLAAVGQGGYEAYPQIDTKARYDAIRALSPEVADEIEKRVKKAHILPAATVAASWPELKRRLLLDRDQAKIRDLKRPQ